MLVKGATDSEVNVNNISHVIVAYILESLLSLIWIKHNVQVMIDLTKTDRTQAQKVKEKLGWLVFGESNSTLVCNCSLSRVMQTFEEQA